MTTTITVCDTCKREDWENSGQEQTDGEILAELIEKHGNGQKELVIRRHSCLMGCKAACNVVVQDASKLSYVLGRFDPTNDAAQGLVEYAKLHAASETGQVPFKQWPQEIKGHFRARIPVTENSNGSE